jgi:hypothetical protein
MTLSILVCAVKGISPGNVNEKENVEITILHH